MFVWSRRKDNLEMYVNHSLETIFYVNKSQRGIRFYVDLYKNHYNTVAVKRRVSVNYEHYKIKSFSFIHHICTHTAVPTLCMRMCIHITYPKYQLYHFLSASSSCLKQVGVYVFMSVSVLRAVRNYNNIMYSLYR